VVVRESPAAQLKWTVVNPSPASGCRWNELPATTHFKPKFGLEIRRCRQQPHPRVPLFYLQGLTASGTQATFSSATRISPPPISSLWWRKCCHGPCLCRPRRRPQDQEMTVGAQDQEAMSPNAGLQKKRRPSKLNAKHWACLGYSGQRQCLALYHSGSRPSHRPYHHDDQWRGARSRLGSRRIFHKLGHLPSRKVVSFTTVANFFARRSWKDRDGNLKRMNRFYRFSTKKFAILRFTEIKYKCV
jgi:hypothetical protein